MPAAGARNPPALLSSKFELLDRTGWQLREQSFEPLEGLESSQYADEGNELGALAGLDSLEGPLADAGLLGELSLGQARFDTVPLDALTQDLSDGCISELVLYLHYSPFTAIRR
jgi:hypothetical protein